MHSQPTGMRPTDEEIEREVQDVMDEIHEAIHKIPQVAALRSKFLNSTLGRDEPLNGDVDADQEFVRADSEFHMSLFARLGSMQTNIDFYLRDFYDKNGYQSPIAA